MNLRVLDHLQPVLEAAQETIVVNQLRRGRGIDPAGSREPAECLAGRADAQLLQSPAPDQLLGLGEELDLPNPAAAGLDVVPFHRDFSAAAVRVDLALDRVDILDGREVEVLPPDERLQLAQKASTRPRGRRRPDGPLSAQHVPNSARRSHSRRAPPEPTSRSVSMRDPGEAEDQCGTNSHRRCRLPEFAPARASGGQKRTVTRHAHLPVPTPGHKG